MPRPKRIDYPGAFHHVMNRGAARQATFLTNQDRDDFSGLWAESVVRFGIVVLAYAWMGNHYHALVVSPDAQLSETLRYIGHVYTQRFNRRNGRDGALFRGRFNSVLIDQDAYLHRVARYIERNPLDAGIVSAAELPLYRWSSLSHYLNPTATDWVTTAPLISRLGSRHAYLRYILNDASDQEIEAFYERDMHERVVLGKQGFVESLPPEVESLRPVAGIPEVSLAEIEHAIFHVDGSPILNPCGRVVAAELGQMLARASRQDLVERYGFPSRQNISVVLQRKRHDPDVVRLRREVLVYLGRSSTGLLAS